jgi:hypothetical protein
MNENTKHERNLPDNRTGLIFSAFFITMLCLGGLISVLVPSEGISEIENRALVPFPKYDAMSLLEGDFTDSLGLYYSDNFPLREDLVTVAMSIKDLSGISTGVKFYGGGGGEGVADKIDTLLTVKADTLKKTPKKDSVKTAAPDYSKSSAIIVYENKAIQMFTGTHDAGRRYADMIAMYKETFDSLQIYCMIAPTPIDFYLPKEYKKSSNYEKKNIEFVAGLLDSIGVTYADAYSEIAKHTDKYIYFNTDHHWTGLGAYYAYRGFCKSAGFNAYDLNQFERKKLKRKFLGSLYGITLDKRLRDVKDSVEYFKLPIPTKTYRWNADSLRFEKTSLFANVPNYANFLGGDHPLVRIESDVNGQKLLIIKDSFGNAVAPFMALHFGTVYVMDYRYYDVNLPDFVKSHGITAIMFLHNTFAVNNKFTSYRGRYFLTYKPKAEQKPAEDVEVQETDTVANHP